MKKIIVSILTVAAVLSSCTNVNKETLGLNPKAPDEYMVVPQSPLILPPEYDLAPVAQPVPVSQVMVEDNLTPTEKAILKRIHNSGISY